MGNCCRICRKKKCNINKTLPSNLYIKENNLNTLNSQLSINDEKENNLLTVKSNNKENNNNYTLKNKTEQKKIKEPKNKKNLQKNNNKNELKTKLNKKSNNHNTFNNQSIPTINSTENKIFQKTNNSFYNQSILKNNNNSVLQNNSISNQNIQNNNNIIIQNQDISKNEDNQIFPQGTKYEEELKSDFRYFNVYWFDKNKISEYCLYKKCFENVEFKKGYDLNSAINFFKKELISEWIVITSGSNGEELIKNLENFECIKTFFIYCKHVEYHEKWAKNMKKVGCITSNPEILCKKFIELNKDYIIPNFNYQCKTNNKTETIANVIYSQNQFDFTIPKLKIIFKDKNKTKNKYNNLCIKLFNEIKQEKFIKDYDKFKNGANSPFQLLEQYFPQWKLQIGRAHV